MLRIRPSTREELAAALSGSGVELGVAAGAFSEVILRNTCVRRLWSVDRWSDHHDEAEYKAAVAALSKYGPRSIVIRDTFANVAPTVLNKSLDFVYIDGYAHEGQEGGKTLDDWWPKVKSGGVFSGHDYHPRWPLTVAAVDAFCKRHQLELYVTGEERWPSWYVLKQ